VSVYKRESLLPMLNQIYKEMPQKRVACVCGKGVLCCKSRVHVCVCKLGLRCRAGKHVCVCEEQFVQDVKCLVEHGEEKCACLALLM